MVLGPAIAIQWCFYHLPQATWRKIQELGLVPRYSTDEEFKLFGGQIDGLAFLPSEDIPAGMTSLRDNTPDGADEQLLYFDRTYVTGSYSCVQPGHGQIGVGFKRILHFTHQLCGMSMRLLSLVSHAPTTSVRARTIA